MQVFIFNKAFFNADKQQEAFQVKFQSFIGKYSTLHILSYSCTT